jgi:hypothetical protein
MNKKLILFCAGMMLISLSACTRKLGGPANMITQAAMGKPVRVSSDNSDAAEPAIAAAPDGAVYIAWVDHHGKEADVLVARTDQLGERPGSATRVNPVSGQATAWRGDPPTVAVAPDGTVYVGWTARVDSSRGQGDDLYLSSSADNGHTFGKPVKVNDDDKPVAHGMHSLAIGNDRNVYVAWLDERNSAPTPVHSAIEGTGAKHHMESNREVFFAVSVDAGGSFGRNQRIAGDVCPCCKTALAVGTDGRVYLSWRQVLPGDFRHIAIASSIDKGATFSEPVIVSDDRWAIGGCPVSGAGLGIAQDGSLRVVWYTEGDAGPPGLYWSESRDGGHSFSAREPLAPGSFAKGTPSVVRGEAGKLVAVWEEDAEGSEPRVVLRDAGARQTEARPIALVGNGELPVAAVGAGKVVVTYLAKSGDHRGVWVQAMSLDDLHNLR